MTLSWQIHRACQSPIVANYLYWYLKVETEDAEAGSKVDLTLSTDLYIDAGASISTHLGKLIWALLN